MDRKLVARAEQIELDATRDLWEAPSTEVGGELGLFAGVVGGAWAFGARSIPDIVMNRVIGLGVFGAARRDDIDPDRRGAMRQVGSIATWSTSRPRRSRPS